MIKKLLQGFMFGCGFTVAMILISWIISFADFSFTSEPKLTSSGELANYEEKANWRELNPSNKIEKASGLALLRFNEGKGKKMEAYVEKVFTKDESVKLPVEVGQRIESADYYAQDGYSRNRNGVLLIYSDNPPKEMEGTYLYEDRLIGLQDMPLNLFIEKFDAKPTN
jgi:hypothetical protein